MATETRHDQITPLSEEPKNREWLINIRKEQERQSVDIREEQVQLKPWLQKVDKRLREIESNNKCEYPSVVSLGPYC